MADLKAFLSAAQSLQLTKAMGEFPSQIFGETVRIGPINVVSSNVEAIAYYPTDSILEIIFKGDRIYQYFDVPFAEFINLFNAPSKGYYVNNFIAIEFDFSQVQ